MRLVSLIVLAGASAFGQSAFGQPRGCEPPKELEAQRRGKSLAQFNNLVGAWFAQHGNNPCAVAAFESALRA